MYVSFVIWLTICFVFILLFTDLEGSGEIDVDISGNVNTSDAVFIQPDTDIMEVNLDAIDTISSEMDSDFIIIDSEKDETDIAIPYNEGDGKSNTNAETVNELINESDNVNGKDLAPAS